MSSVLVHGSHGSHGSHVTPGAPGAHDSSSSKPLDSTLSDGTEVAPNQNFFKRNYKSFFFRFGYLL